MGVILAIGTLKGAWFARSDDRRTWDLDGPHFKGWQVNTFGRAADGSYLATTGSTWYGAAIHRSADLTDWDQVVDGPAYPSSSGRNLQQVWTLGNAGDRLYAGVAEAGLFYSDDSGLHWHPVEGLNDHESRSHWQPGLGGLAAHRILADPADPARLWVGISAVGVFASEDGGASWDLRNKGVETASPDDRFDIGYCVHCLVADPSDADHIWRQDHRGVYRTTDGGRTWEQIQNGVPGAGFGFAIDRDRQSGALFIVPLESDEFRMPVDGHLAVYRSLDGGDTWHECGAWPQPNYAGVLRDAMAVDDAGGVYVGSTGGGMLYSTDAGDSWQTMPWRLPRIVSVHVL